MFKRYFPRIYCWWYGHDWYDNSLFTGFGADGKPLIEYYSDCFDCGKIKQRRTVDSGKEKERLP